MGLVTQSVLTDFDWAWFVGHGVQGPETATFAYGSGSRAGMVMDVFWDDWVNEDQPVLGALVGWTDVDPSSGGLRRYLPFAHPVYQTLWCGGVASVTPMFWKEKTEGDWSGPYNSYQIARLALSFEAKPYTILSDSDLAEKFPPGGDGIVQEWQRYCVIDPALPTVRVLSRAGASMRFSEGDASGKDLTGSVNIREISADIKIRWLQLPWNWALDNRNLPAKALAAGNKVNSDAFMNYAAGTLLLKSARAVPVEAPFLIPGVHLWEPQRYVDLELVMEFFDPPLGTGATTRGHNTAPWYGDPDTTVGDGRYYAVESATGAVGSGDPPYGSAAYANIFTGVNQP